MRISTICYIVRVTDTGRRGQTCTSRHKSNRRRHGRFMRTTLFPSSSLSGSLSNTSCTDDTIAGTEKTYTYRWRSIRNRNGRRCHRRRSQGLLGGEGRKRRASIIDRTGHRRRWRLRRVLSGIDSGNKSGDNSEGGLDLHDDCSVFDW